jgi:hypothetical protein
MNPNDICTREIELELIVQGWSGNFPHEFPRLGANYFLEDARSNGRGIIISEEMPMTADLDKAILDFLSPISDNAESLRAFSPLLRVAVYNRALSCSLHLKSLSLLVKFGAEIEINVYPTADDSKSRSAGSTTGEF